MMKTMNSLFLMAFVAIAANGAPAPPAKKEGRIVGGQITEQANYPFMAALYNPNFKQAVGAAVIIAPNWLLTTTDNCKNVVPDTYALVGTGNVQNGGSIYQLGDFQSSIDGENACIIKLRNRITFNDHVDQITLPPYGYEWPQKTQGDVVGWGATSDDWAEISDELKVIRNMTSFPFNCPESHLGTDHGEYKFCAQSKKKGVTPCSADSGAPLIYNGNILMGLFYRYLPDTTVACSETKMSAYVKIAFAVGWLENRMDDDGKYLKWADESELP